MNTKVPSMQELLEAGVHFGHKVSRGNPRMKPYVFGARDGVSIIDLAQSEEKLKEAVQAAYDLGKSGKQLLLVGTKKQAHSIIENLAKESDSPFLTARWVGGLLTNFEEIRKNIRKLSELKEKKEKGELSHYTKKELLLISRKLEKFESELGGAVRLERIPDAVFIVDAVSDNIAVREARRMGLTVIGLCDSNADPNWFDYPVPANDDGLKSIKLVCDTLVGAYNEGKKEFESKSAANKKAESIEEKTDGKLKRTATTDAQEPKPEIEEQAAAIEEVVEKKIVDDHDRKVA